MARTKEQIKADNLALLPALLEQGATFRNGIERWTQLFATKADGLSYLSFDDVLVSTKLGKFAKEQCSSATDEECGLGCCGYCEEVPTIKQTFITKRFSRSAMAIAEEEVIAFWCATCLAKVDN